ncbi:MAG: Trk system potassium transporter TrkA [Verrucomicrobia bacterium]|nr:Trk system potassium transporter TrkA [Verrucomicrobiota bacterium]
MRILIIGAGGAGRRLATRLCGEKHDVVLVDNRDTPLEEVESQLDMLTVRGEGSSPATLEEAHIRKADLLVAVTNRDEVNILAGLFAHSVGVRHIVVRVSNSDYLSSDKSYDLHGMGIDLVVSQKEECARELFNILTMSGTQEVVELMSGGVLALGLMLHTDSPMIRSPLKDLNEPDILSKLRFIALMRGDEISIPRGDTQFMIGDHLYFVALPEHAAELLDWVHPERPTFAKVVIAGGGDLGLNLATKLEKVSMPVTLLESDEERASYVSGVLSRALVLRGDGLEQDTLENCGISERTAFVAVTGEDERNILACLLAEKKGASFTLAQVGRPEYVPVINSSSLLDRAVSANTAMNNAILRFLRGRNIQAAASFSQLPGELLEVIQPAKSKWTGHKVRDIRMPHGSIIGAIKRDGQVRIATGDSELLEGDRLVIFSLRGTANKIEALFRP